MSENFAGFAQTYALAHFRQTAKKPLFGAPTVKLLEWTALSMDGFLAGALLTYHYSHVIGPFVRVMIGATGTDESVIEFLSESKQFIPEPEAGRGLFNLYYGWTTQTLKLEPQQSLVQLANSKIDQKQAIWIYRDAAINGAVLAWNDFDLFEDLYEIDLDAPHSAQWAAAKAAGLHLDDTEEISMYEALENYRSLFQEYARACAPGIAGIELLLE